MDGDSIAISIIKWPLRPFVRFFVRISNWYQYRKPQIVYKLFWKPYGYTWIQYYSKRLNQFVDLDTHFTESFVKYVSQAEEQALVLKKYGLLPHHTLLDYGCGSLRVGYHLMDYLNQNNYFGIDIAESRIKEGKAYLSAKGFNEAHYQTFTTTNCLLREVQGITFDFVWANSVFTHMPREDILQMLQSLKSNLSKDSKFLFTFSHNTSNNIDAKPMKKSKVIGKDYYHTVDDMKSLCTQSGYTFEILDPKWPVTFSALAQIQLK